MRHIGPLIDAPQPHAISAERQAAQLNFLYQTDDVNKLAAVLKVAELAAQKFMYPWTAAPHQSRTLALQLSRMLDVPYC